MATRLVGLVGWRGMVGSVLMDRMQQENDFALIEPVPPLMSNSANIRVLDQNQSGGILRG